MAYSEILYERDGPIATITLNRPEKLNAYTSTMGEELADAFWTADADDDVRVIIVTGAGRGFCAGADISAGAASFDARSGATKAFGSAKPGGDVRRRGGFVGAIFNCRKPSIVAFNGAAVGVGMTLALPMDIKVASTAAKFGFIFSRRGLVPEAGSAWFLPRLVGMSQALRWCITGRIFDAEEALRGGLISEIVAPDQLQARAREIATHRVSVQATQRLRVRKLEERAVREVGRAERSLPHAKERRAERSVRVLILRDRVECRSEGKALGVGPGAVVASQRFAVGIANQRGAVGHFGRTAEILYLG